MAIRQMARRVFIGVSLVGWIAGQPGCEPALRFGRQLPSGAVRPLQHLPVIAVACPILQFAVETDRRPVGPGGGQDDFAWRSRSRRALGRERLQDRPDLVRVDAPHARVAEFARGPARRGAQRLRVLEFGDDAMRRHLAVRVAGRGDLQLGAHHQRMRELARRCPCRPPESRRHAPRRNPSGRNSATAPADARRSRRRDAPRRGDSISTCSGNWLGTGGVERLAARARTSCDGLHLGHHHVAQAFCRRCRRWWRCPARNAGWSTG